jgi:hypothetical protein
MWTLGEEATNLFPHTHTNQKDMFIKLLQLEKLDTTLKLRHLKSVVGERFVGMYAEYSGLQI